MKQTIIGVLCVIVGSITLVSLALTQGCTATHPTTVAIEGNPTDVHGSVTTQVTSNISVGVTGHVDPSNTSNWSAGVVITFKEAPPAWVVAKLNAAGAVQARGEEYTWTLVKANAAAKPVQDAVIAALSVEGTSIKRMNP